MALGCVPLWQTPDTALGLRQKTTVAQDLKLLADFIATAALQTT
jgi:hypothetical protein